MKGKFSKELIGIALLLVAFVIAGLFASSPDQDSDRTVGHELTADPSIYNDRPHGSRALFEWTSKLGYHAVVERTDWQHLPTNAKVLISVAPESLQGFDISDVMDDSGGEGKLSPDDARGVERWLRSGRTLLLLTSRLPSRGDENADASGSADDKEDSDSSGKPTFGDIAGVTVETAQSDKQTSFVPLQVSPLVSGVNSIELTSGDSIVYRKQRDFIPLFASVTPLHGNIAEVGPAVADIPVGKGHLIVVADDYFACNSNLPEADNAAFIANVIAVSTRPGGEVLFDEYHHGDVTSADTDLWSAMGHPLQYAAWQLCFVVILIIAMVAPRFGAVRSLKRGEVRASGEYLTSLAGLYRRAEATVPALEIIYRQFLRDLCERLALPPDVSLEKLAEVASKQSKINPNSLKRLIAACETALDRKRLSTNDLLALTKQMEQVKRQLN